MVLDDRIILAVGEEYGWTVLWYMTLYGEGVAEGLVPLAILSEQGATRAAVGDVFRHSDYGVYWRNEVRAQADGTVYASARQEVGMVV